MCTIGPTGMIDFVSRFRRDNPGVELNLIEAVPDRLLERIMQGELDIALPPKPGPIDERFDVKHLYRERFVVAFPPGHRFEAKNAVRFADLDGESYLPRLNCEHFEHLAELRRQSGAKITYGYRSEREDWFQSMIMAGMGVCFVPESTITVPGVQTRPLVDPVVTRDISLITTAGRRFSPAVAAFMRLATSYR